MNENIPNQIELSGEDFDHIFNKRENIDFFGNSVEILDITPEKLTIPTPMLIAPGWGETIDTFKETIRSFYDGGRRVLCLSHLRHGDEMESVDSDMKDVYGPEAELRKALSILELLNEKTDGTVDVLAHSEGGINTAIAASLQVEKFKNIIFTNSGGIMGPDSFPELSTRFTINTIKEALRFFGSTEPKERSNIGRNLSGTFGYILKNPLRATKESFAISSKEIDGVLNYLHETGVGVVVICGKDDPLFPVDRVKKMLQDKHIDKFLVLEGGHNHVTSNPEMYVAAIENTLRSTENIS